MDTLTKAARSRLMSKIRGDNLKPETRLLDAFLRAGFREGPRSAGDQAPFFLRNDPGFAGRPDFMFLWPGGGLAVFVHGCFWHGCPEHFKVPKTRSSHWRVHVAKNKARDARVLRKLRLDGYRTAVVWEHSLKSAFAAAAAADRVRRRVAGLTRPEKRVDEERQATLT